MRIEEFNVKGFFWLPETPDVRIPGILHVSDGGRIKLDTIGNLIALPFFLDVVPQIKRVCGCVEKHREITLEDCIFESRHNEIGGITTAAFRAGRAFLGASFEANDHPLFDYVSFRVDGLDEWVAITGIKTDFNAENDSSTITYTRPSKVQLWQGDGYTFTLQFAYTPAAPGLTQASVRQESYLVFDSDKPRSLDELLDTVGQIRNLLCVAIDENVCLKDINVKSPTILEQVGETLKRKMALPVVFESVRFREAPAEVRGHKMLFRLESIATNTQAVIAAWMHLHEKAGPAISLFLTARAGEHAYLNFAFLSVAQAVETLHHRLNPSQGDRVHLKVRLAELFSAFAKHFPDDPKRAALIDKIVITRDYFTHYNPAKEKDAAKGQDLWTVYCLLEVLFQLNVLKELGFAETAIDALVAKNYSLQEKLKLKLL